MRHRVDHRKLGRVTEHRLALLRSLAQSLLRHERIRTTLPKAKELRRFVERLITVAKQGLEAGDGAAVRARRLVRRDLADPAVVKKLFDTLAPRFRDRPGGYTRILRVGYRRGDNAEMADIELIGSEYRPAAAAPAKAEAPAAPGVGGRLKAAAARWRGKAKTPPEGETGQ
jgi:large subunit ribosomal protein L17